jgi:hypothetical protein
MNAGGHANDVEISLEKVVKGCEGAFVVFANAVSGIDTEAGAIAKLVSKVDQESICTGDDVVKCWSPESLLDSGDHDVDFESSTCSYDDDWEFIKSIVVTGVTVTGEESDGVESDDRGCGDDDDVGVVIVVVGVARVVASMSPTGMYVFNVEPENCDVRNGVERRIGEI